MHSFYNVPGTVLTRVKKLNIRALKFFDTDHFYWLAHFCRYLGEKNCVSSGRSLAFYLQFLFQIIRSEFLLSLLQSDCRTRQKNS